MLSQFIERFHNDPEFQRLALRDAGAALRAAGVGIPGGVSVEFMSNTEAALQQVLDASLADGELSDAMLDQVAGGVTHAACETEIRAFLGLLRTPQGN